MRYITVYNPKSQRWLVVDTKAGMTVDAGLTQALAEKRADRLNLRDTWGI